VRGPGDLGAVVYVGRSREGAGVGGSAVYPHVYSALSLLGVCSKVNTVTNGLFICSLALDFDGLCIFLSMQLQQHLGISNYQPFQSRLTQSHHVMFPFPPATTNAVPFHVPF
jgi:hypothetical protein